MHYFYDLGAFNGAESLTMAALFEELQTDYRIFAFEPCAEAASRLFQTLRNPKIAVLPLAIADLEGTTHLYHAQSGNEAGHSIFASKCNVTPNYETVRCVRFSDWLLANVPDFKESVNVLKFNIEGAEWFLLRDLLAADLARYFQVVCGDADDVTKIRQLDGLRGEHAANLCDCGFDLFTFSGQAGCVPESDLASMRAALRKVRST